MLREDKCPLNVKKSSDGKCKAEDEDQGLSVLTKSVGKLPAKATCENDAQYWTNIADSSFKKVVNHENDAYKSEF